MQHILTFPINEFPGYIVYSNGTIYSLFYNKFLKIHTNLSIAGYCTVILRKAGKNCYKSLHRLVALTFIPNPESKPQVNHKDGNKSNNKVENLEWVTAKENIAHAIKLGLINRKGISNYPLIGTKKSEETKKIMSEKKKGSKHPKFKGLIVTPFGKFESSYDAAKAEGCSHMTIQTRCKNEKLINYYIKSK